MSTIATKGKRPNWAKIRAEYIGGGIGYRELAKKHGVSFRTLSNRAISEGWAKDREQACNKGVTLSVQKTANSAAANADIAARIKAKLLIRLETELDALPETIGTEAYADKKKYKLRDLTGAYRDLVADMPRADGQQSAALERAREILGGVQSAVD